MEGEFKPVCIFGTRFTKNVTRRSKTSRTRYFDYLVINKKTYNKFLFGETMTAIISAVKNNLFDEILENPENRENTVLSYFKDKLYNYSDLFLMFDINADIVANLKLLSANITALEETKCNSEDIIKSVICEFKSEEWYSNLRNNDFIYVDYGLGNFPYYNNLRDVIQIINHQSNNYLCHTVQQVSSLLDICLITLYYIASYKMYISKCRLCGNFTVGTITTGYCRGCKHRTNRKKINEYYNDNLKRQYLHIYNRLYKRIQRSKDKSQKAKNQKALDEYSRQYKELIIQCAFLNDSEKEKALKNFFNLWREL